MHIEVWMQQCRPLLSNLAFLPTINTPYLPVEPIPGRYELRLTTVYPVLGGHNSIDEYRQHCRKLDGFTIEIEDDVFLFDKGLYNGFHSYHVVFFSDEI